MGLHTCSLANYEQFIACKDKKAEYTTASVCWGFLDGQFIFAKKAQVLNLVINSIMSPCILSKKYKKNEDKR